MLPWCQHAPGGMHCCSGIHATRVGHFSRRFAAALAIAASPCASLALIGCEAQYAARLGGLTRRCVELKAGSCYWLLCPADLTALPAFSAPRVGQMSIWPALWPPEGQPAPGRPQSESPKSLYRVLPTIPREPSWLTLLASNVAVRHTCANQPVAGVAWVLGRLQGLLSGHFWTSRPNRGGILVARRLVRGRRARLRRRADTCGGVAPREPAHQHGWYQEP